MKKPTSSSERTRIFHVTVKALSFDRDGRLLLIKEKSGRWDLPGGRVEHGENLQQTLMRECQEEMGLQPHILDQHPHWAWSARHHDGWWKVVLGFRVKFPKDRFTPSEECVAVRYMGSADLKRLPLAQQTIPLIKLLRASVSKKARHPRPLRPHA